MLSQSPTLEVYLWQAQNGRLSGVVRARTGGCESWAEMAAFRDVYVRACEPGKVEFRELYEAAVPRPTPLARREYPPCINARLRAWAYCEWRAFLCLSSAFCPFSVFSLRFVGSGQRWDFGQRDLSAAHPQVIVIDDHADSARSGPFGEVE